MKWILMLSPTKKSDDIIHNTFGEDGVKQPYKPISKNEL